MTLTLLRAINVLLEGVANLALMIAFMSGAAYVTLPATRTDRNAVLIVSVFFLAGIGLHFIVLVAQQVIASTNPSRASAYLDRRAT